MAEKVRIERSPRALFCHLCVFFACACLIIVGLVNFHRKEELAKVLKRQQDALGSEESGGKLEGKETEPKTWISLSVCYGSNTHFKNKGTQLSSE